MRHHVISSTLDQIVDRQLNCRNRRIQVLIMAIYCIFNVRALLILILKRNHPVVHYLGDEFQMMPRIGMLIHFGHTSFNFMALFVRLVIFLREKSNQLEFLTDFRHFLPEFQSKNNSTLMSQQILFLNSKNQRKIMKRALIISNISHKSYYMTSAGFCLFIITIYVKIFMSARSLSDKVMAILWPLVIIPFSDYVSFDFRLSVPDDFPVHRITTMCALNSSTIG